MLDNYDNAISTSSDQAREFYDQGVRHFLGGQYAGLNAFAQSVEADPDFALAHAGLARAQMMSGDMAAAKASITTAASLPNVTPREQSHISAMVALLSGDPVGARKQVQAHVLEYPRDAMAAQLCTNVFGLIGFSGKVGREADLLAYTQSLLPHYGDDWWMTSMHALSLCETGQAEASLPMMEKTLAQNAHNANGAHFKAHALYEIGEVKQGRAYLRDWMAGYDNRSVLHSHLSWHEALWALHDDDPDAMWLAVDAGVAPGAATGLPINVLTDTAAIYYRASLAGETVDPARWAALSDYAAQFFPNTGQSFADLHAALSHAMAGEGARLAHIIETAKGYAGDLVQPMAKAWGAIAREDWSLALAEMTPVLATTERLGGSRAQRDLLELAYVNVLLRLGLSDEAHRSLAMRRPVLAPKPPLLGWS